MSKMYVNTIYPRDEVAVTLGKPIIFSVAANTAHQAGGAVDQGVIKTFPNIILNVGNAWDSTNNRFIAPIAGYYMLSFCGINAGVISDHQTQVIAHVIINSTTPTQILAWSFNNVNRDTLSGSGVVFMNKNDYAQVRVQANYAPLTWDNSGLFSGYLIG